MALSADFFSAGCAELACVLGIFLVGLPLLFFAGATSTVGFAPRLPNVAAVVFMAIALVVVCDRGGSTPATPFIHYGRTAVYFV